MRTRTDAVVFTTLKNKDIITTDTNGHTILNVTKLLDTNGSEFLKCRNVGDYTVGEIEKLKHKLKIGTVVKRLKFHNELIVNMV